MYRPRGETGKHRRLKISRFGLSVRFRPWTPTFKDDMSKRFLEHKITNLPICIDLVNNYEQIKKEVIAFCNSPEALIDYPNYPVVGYEKIYENYWKAAPLSKFKDEYIELRGSVEQQNLLSDLTLKARAACPTIVKCISELEEQGKLANSFISRLLPGTIINPHYGWSNKWLRVHLGLVCDPDCKITIGNHIKETRTWEEGKLLAFYDGGQWPHGVKHEGTKERIILSVDIDVLYIKEKLNETV